MFSWRIFAQVEEVMQGTRTIDHSCHHHQTVLEVGVRVTETRLPIIYLAVTRSELIGRLSEVVQDDDPGLSRGSCRAYEQALLVNWSSI